MPRDPGDGEGPVRQVRVAPFQMAPRVVTNEQFARFAKDTGYRTEAERFGWSYVFAAFLPGALRRASPRPAAAPWWCGVESACWAAPKGPAVRRAAARSIRWCRCPGTTLPPTATGRGCGCPQRSNGSTRPEGDRYDAVTRGATSSPPVVGTVATSGRDIFPPGTPPRTAFAAPHRPTPTGPTASGSTTWPATSGSGARTGGPSSVPAPRAPGRPPGRGPRGRQGVARRVLPLPRELLQPLRVAARTHNSPDSTSGNTGFRCTGAA